MREEKNKEGQAEGGVGEEEVDKGENYGMEMLELGQGCGDGNGTWTTLAVRKGRREGEHGGNSSILDFSPQFNNNNKIKAVILLFQEIRA